jgi:hypothetical protein
VRCWIDKKSVDNALTANNIGAKNATMEVLDERARELMEAQQALQNGESASA